MIERIPRSISSVSAPIALESFGLRAVVIQEASCLSVHSHAPTYTLLAPFRWSTAFERYAGADLSPRRLEFQVAVQGSEQVRGFRGGLRILRGVPGGFAGSAQPATAEFQLTV